MQTTSDIRKAVEAYGQPKTIQPIKGKFEQAFLNKIQTTRNNQQIVYATETA